MTASQAARFVPWHVTGSYFEACNCEAICPCRWQGGMKPDAVMTYGVCDFALSWKILEGHSGKENLSGLSVVMAGSYRESEPNKPWRVTLYADERAGPAQHDALAAIFLGRAGGGTFRNYGKRIGEVYAIRSARIELDHTPRRWFIRASDYVEVRASEIVHADAPVSCGIPGHDRPGEELRPELMRVNDPPLTYEVRGRCGFETDFDYSSDEAAG